MDKDEKKTDSEMDEALIKKQKRRRTIRSVIIAIEIIAIMTELVVLFVVTKLERVQRVDISVDELQENMSDEVIESAQNGQMKGYTNIALFGVDTRTGELKSGTRTDTIMIASINNTTNEIKLVSVYRDTYLNIGNDTYNKANSAYSSGGPTQAINMLNQNLDLNITDFVTVGFAGLVDVIDALGGIDIELTDAEVGYLNDYQKIMASQLDMEYIEVTESGTQHLNGLQATAYCRIRYTSGDDFKRTERQRLVLSKVFEAASSASITELNAIVDAVADEIYTSLTTSEILSYVSNITSYSLEESEGFPQEEYRTTGTVGRKGSCVIPVTLEQNVIWLHEYLFDDYDYTASSKVKECSQKIEEDTGYTLDDDGNITTYTGDSSTTTTTTTNNSNTTTNNNTTTTTTDDSNTATTTNPYEGLASMTDPNTGATVWYDPYTGVVIDPATGAATGAMADPATGNVVYPSTDGTSTSTESATTAADTTGTETVTETAPATDAAGTAATVDPATATDAAAAVASY